MPERPTPGVNGQVRSSPALQASMSMLSFAPAARMSGLTGLTARPGSFCLFCENRVSTLPTVTSVEPPGVSGAASVAHGTSNVSIAAAAAVANRLVRMTPPRYDIVAGQVRGERVSGASGARPWAEVAASLVATRYSSVDCLPLARRWQPGPRRLRHDDA